MATGAVWFALLALMTVLAFGYAVHRGQNVTVARQFLDFAGAPCAAFAIYLATSDWRPAVIAASAWSFVSPAISALPMVVAAEGPRPYSETRSVLLCAQCARAIGIATLAVAVLSLDFALRWMLIASLTLTLLRTATSGFLQPAPHQSGVERVGYRLAACIGIVVVMVLSEHIYDGSISQAWIAVYLFARPIVVVVMLVLATVAWAWARVRA